MEEICGIFSYNKESCSTNNRWTSSALASFQGAAVSTSARQCFRCPGPQLSHGVKAAKGQAAQSCSGCWKHRAPCSLINLPRQSGALRLLVTNTYLSASQPGAILPPPHPPTPLPETFSSVWRHFWFSQLGGMGVLLTSSGQRPEVLLNSLHWPGRAPTTRKDQAQMSAGQRGSAGCITF